MIVLSLLVATSTNMCCDSTNTCFEVAEVQECVDVLSSYDVEAAMLSGEATTLVQESDEQIIDVLPAPSCDPGAKLLFVESCSDSPDAGDFTYKVLDCLVSGIDPTKMANDGTAYTVTWPNEEIPPSSVRTFHILPQPDLLVWAAITSTGMVSRVENAEDGSASCSQ